MLIIIVVFMSKTYDTYAYNACLSDISVKLSQYESLFNDLSQNKSHETADNGVKQWDGMPSWEQISQWLPSLFPEWPTDDTNGNGVPSLPFPSPDFGNDFPIELNAVIDNLIDGLNALRGAIDLLIELLGQLKGKPSVSGVSDATNGTDSPTSGTKTTSLLRHLLRDISHLYQPFIDITNKFNYILKSHFNYL